MAIDQSLLVELIAGQSPNSHGIWPFHFFSIRVKPLSDNRELEAVTPRDYHPLCESDFEKQYEAYEAYQKRKESHAAPQGPAPVSTVHISEVSRYNGKAFGDPGTTLDKGRQIHARNEALKLINSPHNILGHSVTPDTPDDEVMELYIFFQEGVNELQRLLKNSTSQATTRLRDALAKEQAEKREKKHDQGMKLAGAKDEDERSEWWKEQFRHKTKEHQRLLATVREYQFEQRIPRFYELPVPELKKQLKQALREHYLNQEKEITNE